MSAAASHAPGRQCDACEGHCLAPITAQAATGRQPIRSREAELEATVADRLRAAIVELEGAQAAAVAAGYGDQFRDELDHAIDQVELTRRMLA